MFRSEWIMYSHIRATKNKFIDSLFTMKNFTALQKIRTIFFKNKNETQMSEILGLGKTGAQFITLVKMKKKHRAILFDS